MKKYLLTLFAGFAALLFIASTTAINGSGIIDLGALENYANQSLPNYIQKDNTPPNNDITDLGATLGRVLFYDKRLSIDNTIACASCHQQAFAFSDTALASVGVNGTTGRHSMRIVNSRFSRERRFFWDERANTLEQQTTQPIQDHAEMGFSGQNGDPNLDSLIRKMDNLTYYQDLFYAIYGDTEITERRMQLALAQFIRSIQSFDAKYDAGRATAPNDNAPFANFTPEENQGKNLFLAPPQVNPAGQRVNGGAGCAGCHQPPEFDITPNALHNGVIHSIDGGIDLTNTRSPSLRNSVGPNGSFNGAFMHNGELETLADVIDHYNSLPARLADSALYVNSLDNRLKTPMGIPLSLNLTQAEQDALIAFLQTLTGSDVYTDPRWSDPFDVNGNLTILNSTLSVEAEIWEEQLAARTRFYPNPTTGVVNIEIPEGSYHIFIRNMQGTVVSELDIISSTQFDLSSYASGLYFVEIRDQQIDKMLVKRVLKY